MWHGEAVAVVVEQARAAPQSHVANKNQDCSWERSVSGQTTQPRVPASRR